MKRLLVVMTALALGLGIPASADVFNLGAGYTNLETVVVENAGNAADTRVMRNDGTTGYGSVGYNYNIGKYEVTAGQYTAFLNAVAATDTYDLYNNYMANTVNYYGCNIQRTGNSGSYSYTVGNGSQTDINNWANRPVNYVSFWDSCRFANWLCNGQGNSSTETGAYTMTPTGIANNTITRNAGATWAVTSEDEWYKAAFYDPNKAGGAGYWIYPTRSDGVPANRVLPTDPGNSANYKINAKYSIGSPYWRTNVGEFENSASAYGTFDQGGNVCELNEAILNLYGPVRGVRDGSLSYDDNMQSYFRGFVSPSSKGSSIGFRVVQIVPEPSSILAIFTGLIPLGFMFRRRK